MKLVLKNPANGYPKDDEKANKLIKRLGKDPILTIKSVKIENWFTWITFEEDPSNYYNSVQFELHN